MRVAVEATCWTNRRGYGRFTRGILNALSETRPVELMLVADAVTAGNIDPPSRSKIVPVDTSVTVAESASATGNRSLRDLLRMSTALSRLDADVVFYPSVYSYAPYAGPAPQVLTVHDAIPESFPGLVFPTARGRLLWTLKVRLALAKARRIVTVSPYAARQVRARLGVRPEKLAVINEAADPVFTAGVATGGSSRPYLLFVGGQSPHKDLPSALRAYARIAGHFPDLRLKFAGEVEKDSFHSEATELRALAVAFGIAGRIDWLGYVPDADLAALYQRAVALILPSFAEGFGLPMIEAAACGCPVVASKESGVLELLGDADLVFPAGNVEALANQLAVLLTSPALADRLRERGLRKSCEYTWERAAGALYDVLCEVSNGNRGAA
jgi:glycosyltransferase involved in cell wall biosynthesis